VSQKAQITAVIAGAFPYAQPTRIATIPWVMLRTRVAQNPFSVSSLCCKTSSRAYSATWRSWSRSTW